MHRRLPARVHRADTGLALRGVDVVIELVNEILQWAVGRRFTALVLLLSGCAMEPAEVQKQIAECQQRGWYPVYTINGRNDITRISCLPTQDAVDVAEAKGWYW